MHYLEIGVRQGDSLVSVLKCPRVTLAVGIDLWDCPEVTIDQLMKRLDGDMDRVVVISGNSHAILPGLRHPFDFIYVDGDHSEEGAALDIEQAWALLAPGGSMLVDDCDHPNHRHIRDTCGRLAGKWNVGVDFHPIGTVIAEIKKPYDYAGR